MGFSLANSLGIKNQFAGITVFEQNNKFSINKIHT